MSRLSILKSASATRVLSCNKRDLKLEKCFSVLCGDSKGKNEYFGGNLKRMSSAVALGEISKENVVLSPFGGVEVPKENLTEFIFKTHEEYKDAPAITCGPSGRSYSYGACYALTRRCAAALLASPLRLQPGDMLGVILPNIPEFSVIVNGALLAGIKVTPANPLYTEDEITRQFIDSGVKAIATIELLMGKAKGVEKSLKDFKGTIVVGGKDSKTDKVFSLQSLLEADYKADLPRVDVDSIALVPYSSGTTGLPKGVLLSHKSLTVNLRQMQSLAFRKYENTTENPLTVLTVPPFFHIYGFNGILNFHMSVGNHIVSMPKFTPEDYIACLMKYRPASLFVVPSLLTFLASHPLVTTDHLSSIQQVMIGAAPSTESTLDKFLHKCQKSRDEVRLQHGFGMTESSPAISITPYVSPKSKLCSVGQLVPGTEAKVVSLTTGDNLGHNLSGELLIRGPQVMLGYLNNEAATQETIDAEGWLHTGDVGYYDEDQFFYIVDRTKELIKVKGNQVSPTELENIILEIPEVADAAVVGIPDHLAGELPRAFVVLKQGAKLSPENVADWVAKKVVKYKQLKGGVHIIDAIPRNPGGKIMRNQLKVLGNSR